MRSISIVLAIFWMGSAYSTEMISKYGAENQSETVGLGKRTSFDFRLRVVDDEGLPVKGVRCSGWAYLENDPKHGAGHEGVSDSNGVVRVAGVCDEWVSVNLRKEGYYGTALEERYPKDICPNVVGGKWQPYGELRTVVLKRVIDPVPMIKSPYRISKSIPEGEWHGYDLVFGDWTPPYGEGLHEDVLVRRSVSAVNDTSDFRVSMDLCFTNNLHSGVYLNEKTSWSDMTSDYHAKTNAIYLTDMSFVFEQHPHQPAVDTRLGKDSYLVFRIRTQSDADGNLVSAHYGKIVGPWLFFSKMPSPEVFFNPTPNDTNLEDEETACRSRLRYKQSLEFKKNRSK